MRWECKVTSQRDMGNYYNVLMTAVMLLFYLHAFTQLYKIIDNELDKIKNLKFYGLILISSHILI